MNHNLGPIPKIVVATTLTFGAVGAAVGGAIDHFASEGVHMPDREYDQDGRWVGSSTLSSRSQELQDANTNLEETRADVEAIVARLLDERCRTAVRPYRLGGEFADVPEEGAVSDLVAEPNLPCQNWRKQVRAVIRAVRYQDARVQQELNDVALANENLEEFKGYKEDDKDFHGFLFGGLIFAAAGLANRAKVEARRNRSRGGTGGAVEGATEVDDANPKT